MAEESNSFVPHQYVCLSELKRFVRLALKLGNTLTPPFKRIIKVSTNQWTLGCVNVKTMAYLYPPYWKDVVRNIMLFQDLLLLF